MSTRTFPVSGPISVVCKFGFGSLIVTADDQVSEAQVTLKARDPESDVLSRATVDMHETTLTVQGPKPRGGVFDLPVFNSRARVVDAMCIGAIGGRGVVERGVTVARHCRSPRRGRSSAAPPAISRSSTNRPDLGR